MNNETGSLKRRGRPATGQAKTPAQRMQERRQRMKHGETGDRDRGGEREITLTLTFSALNALRRLSKRDGVTQKAFINTLLLDTENKLLQGFDDAELEQYLSETQTFKPPVQDAVTPDQEQVEQRQEGAPAAEAVSNTEESRISDQASNTGRSKADNPKSGYVGVTWHSQSGKWQVNVRENNKQKSLGTCDTPEEGHAKRLAYLAERDGK